MGISGRKTKLYKKWISLSIRKRNGVFTGIVFFIISLSIIFGFWVVNFYLNDFRDILDDNAKSSDFMDCIEEESRTFEAFMKHSSEENQKAMQQSFENTEKAVIELPFRYKSMSVQRYAKTWSIRNSYENYIQKRDSILRMSEENNGYIKELYKVYEIQAYLQDYARILMINTLEDGKEVYINKVQSIKQLPVLIIVTGLLLISVMISLSNEMNKTMISPIMKLVKKSKEIAANNFFTEDVRVDNQDEIGELVKAFNKMKYATGQYITTLEEKREMMDLLHKEELEKIEAEKNLESANLELLKSQINPHFLFNTLNVIGGMANLEDANTTEKMIRALSTIFRYNLKNQENEVVLSKEIQVVQDYLYLQKMRFGNRINFYIKSNIDMDTVIVPTFTFQPLVENAIIHGISKKEEGGKIGIYIKMKDHNLIVSIVDTGVGMTKLELEHLKSEFKKGQTAKLGIGLGNVYKRVHGMYDKGEVLVLSKKNAGTIVKLIIPQKKQEVSDVSRTNCR
jgi:sensor histidine kinase YesM